MKGIGLSLVAGALWILAACEGENGSQGATDDSKRPLADKSAQAPARPELEAVLKSYEKLRALLAEGKTVGVPEAAVDVSAAAEKAGKDAPEVDREHLAKLAEAAGDVKEMKEVDLSKARKAFGEMSRHAIALVAARPSLAQGRYVFQCAMTRESYPKWIQTTAGVSNPYMGPKMPG